MIGELQLDARKGSLVEHVLVVDCLQFDPLVSRDAIKVRPFILRDAPFVPAETKRKQIRGLWLVVLQNHL